MRVDLAFTYAMPASWPKWRAEEATRRLKRGEIVPCTRGDRDNLAKAILDALEGIFYVNDRQIMSGEISKSYALRSGVRVEISTLPDMPESKKDLAG